MSDEQTIKITASAKSLKSSWPGVSFGKGDAVADDEGQSGIVAGFCEPPQTGWPPVVFVSIDGTAGFCRAPNQLRKISKA